MRSPRFAVVTLRLSSTGPVSITDPLAVDVALRVEQALADEPEGTPQILPVACDPHGRPVVRGTSVFGSLRAHLARYELSAGVALTMVSIDSRSGRRRWSRRATLADLLCGSEPEERGKDGKAPTLRPSAVRSAAVEVASTAHRQSRARTAVARDRGAPVPHKLFGREELRGLVLDVVLQVDLPILEAALAGWGITEREAAQRAIADLLAAAHAWRPSLGGGVNVGFGATGVSRVRWGVADPLPMTRLLAAASTLDLFRSVATSTASAREPLLSLCAEAHAGGWRFEVSLRCVDPLLVAPTAVAAENAAGRKNCARTADAVSGSSWRGLFRSRSEFILRTCGIESCRSAEHGTCGRCPTCILFGWTPRAGQGTGAPQGGAAGLVRFRDSPVSGETMTYTHAPIDRFTGGATDGKLYTRTSWASGSTLSLVVEQSAPTRPVPAWATHLFILVVLDLHDGLVGVGNSTTRGYGTLAVEAPDELPAVPADWLDAVPRPSSTSTTGGAR